MTLLLDNQIVLPSGGNYAAASQNAILRGLAIDNARSKINVSTIPDIVDNSTGTASLNYTIEALTIPAPYTKTGTDIASKTAFDAAVVKIDSALNSLLIASNRTRRQLGLPMIIRNSSAVVTAAIPALDLALVAVNGTGNNAVEANTAIAQLTIIRNNFATVLAGINALGTALGYPIVEDISGGATYGNWASTTLVANAATAAGVAGTASTQSLADPAVDAFLTSIANNIATVTFYLNSIQNPADSIILTNGGNAGVGSTVNPPVVAAAILPVAHTVSGSSAAAKADVDIIVAQLNNNTADYGAAINDLLDVYTLGNIPKLIDATTATVNTTIEIVSATNTGVDGVGNNAVDVTTAIARLTSARNNYATLIAKTNALLANQSLSLITDNSGGIASITGTLVNAGAATAAGVAGTALGTIAVATLNTMMTSIKNLEATLYARILFLTPYGQTQPLQVVAGL